MKMTSFVCGMLFALAVAAGLAYSRRAQAAEPAPAAQVQVVAETRDTKIYLVKYQKHTCFVASTVGGSGISLQCPE